MVRHELNSLLQKAIEKEEEARDLYRKAADMAQGLASTAQLQNLALEEQRHKSLLEELLSDYMESGAAMTVEEPLNPEIFAALEPLLLDSQIAFHEIFTLAMKHEEESSNFYAFLAERVSDAEAKGLLEDLSRWETSHGDQLREYYREYVQMLEN